MKKTLLAIMVTLSLAGAMIFSANMLARAGASPGTLAGQDDRKEGRERHPEIRQAIRHLQMAKDALQNAKHDFGGHRVEALKHTDQAIEECHKALESDEK